MTNGVEKFTSFTRFRRVLGLSYPAAKQLAEGFDQLRIGPRSVQLSLASIEARLGEAAIKAIREDIAAQRQHVNRDWRSPSAKTPIKRKKNVHPHSL